MITCFYGAAGLEILSSEKSDQGLGWFKGFDKGWIQN